MNEQTNESQIVVNNLTIALLPFAFNLYLDEMPFEGVNLEKSSLVSAEFDVHLIAFSSLHTVCTLFDMMLAPFEEPPSQAICKHVPHAQAHGPVSN